MYLTHHQFVLVPTTQWILLVSGLTLVKRLRYKHDKRELFTSGNIKFADPNFYAVARKENKTKIGYLEKLNCCCNTCTSV